MDADPAAMTKPATDPATEFEQLMGLASLGSLGSHTALERIAALVNLSDILGRKDGALRALKWCDEFDAKETTPEYAAVSSYFRSNAWAALVAIRNSDPKASWAWDQPEIAQQILHLRKTLNSAAFEKLPKLYRCQTLTNLGNQLNAVGRFIEALEYWARALSVDPNFWMAQGNRGYALIHYAKSHYDRGHAAALLLSAHQDLSRAIEIAPLHLNLGYQEALDAFVAQRVHATQGINVKQAEKEIRLDGYELGESDEEQRYRRWCLSNRLFLNALNDLGPHSIAGRDILTLPDFVTKLKKPPSLTGFFNQMKQEFVSARWMYYEGVTAVGPHFSDREVLLFNTLDYPAYGLNVEKIKIAMRTAYSLFDKIAFFLNRYMRLNVPVDDVSFGRIWKRKPASPVRPEFENSENWPFRGLYWLSKDIRDKAFKDSPEPDARELHELRNHVEHGYLKVHEMQVGGGGDPDSPLAWMVDDLAYSVVRDELNAKTLRVLKLARAALMYLSFGMYREERRRSAQHPADKAYPMTLDTWEDSWKQ